MVKKKKMWKPGQLVTIENKVYRVVKSQFGCVDCANAITMPYDIPCIVCMAHRQRMDTILEEIKPKSVMG